MASDAGARAERRPRRVLTEWARPRPQVTIRVTVSGVAGRAQVIVPEDFSWLA
jgi:hypothetical protein